MTVAGLWATTVSAQTALDSLDRVGERLGWEAVGRLDTPTGTCTATLISRDLVLTAAHCVLGPQGLDDADRVIFRAGFTNGDSVAERKVSRIAVDPGYVPSPDGRLQPDMVRHDVALLRLERPISTAEADPFLLYDDPVESDRVSVVSYGRGRQNALSRQRECSITQIYRGGEMAFDCDVTFGSSGAPVFMRYGNRMRIVSVVSGGDLEGSGSTQSYGMSLTSIVPELKRELGRAAQSAPVSAGARRVQIGQRSTSGGARFVRARD